MTNQGNFRGINGAGEAYMGRLEEAASYIKNRLGEIPDTLLILGSGLGSLAELVTIRAALPYAEIPHMPVVSTDGHAGNLLVGTLGGREVALFQGRVHYHDGLSASEVVFGVRAMALLGMKQLFVTNAAGSIRSDLAVGDLMVIENHVSLFLPEDPSLRLEHPRLGEKFYPQTDPYDRVLGDAFLAAAVKRGWSERCRRGTYCFLPGPRYESRADIAVLRALGVVDAVGMSTVPEVLAGLQMTRGALRVLGVSTITNVAAGLSDVEPNHAEVKAAGLEAAPRLRTLIADTVSSL